MNEKETLIHDLINDGRESLEETLKEYEERLEDYRKNGLPEGWHPNHEKGYEASITYTQGYCIGHLELLKQINALLDSDVDGLKDLIQKNIEISEANRKHFDEVFGALKIVKRKIDEDESEG